MAPLYDGEDYYKKMFELQEKLRKSEEERIRLEERFNVLVQESRNRHDACINRLRMKYIQYLEEQRMRDERNHKLLVTLDKITNKLALISAKKDRLNVLRKQYEAYLIRVYANRRLPGSVTGDSGIASQNEDRCSRKTVTTARPDLTSATIKSGLSPRVYQPPLQSSQPRTTSAPKFHDQSLVDNISLNNPTILPTTPLDVPLDVDHQTSILRTPHVYAPLTSQSGDQLVQIPIPMSAVRQYPRTTFTYDENIPGNPQDVSNFGVPYANVPVLSMTSSDQGQPDVALVNRFFRQHVETVQTIPGFSTIMRLPEDTAQYENVSRNEIARSNISRSFDPSISAQPFQHHDTNMLLANQRSPMREYVPSDVEAAAFTHVTGKSDTYSTRIGTLPGYMDYTMTSPQKSEDEGSTRSLTSDDVDDLIRRNEHLLWTNANAAKMTRRPSIPLNASNVNVDENGRSTAILENELDRYINNIRRLHREHGVPSQEEVDHEQNTSGDLLNVTLSEDAMELPVEKQVKKEKVPKEMDRILTLANDLVSRTADPMEVTHSVEQNDDDIKTEIRDEIREDIAKHQTELEQLQKDTKITKENWNNDDSAKLRECIREVPSLRKDDEEEVTSTSPNKRSPIDSRKQTEAKQLNLVTGKESDIEGLFDIAGELAPWNLANVQKRVQELCLDDDQPIEREVEETAKNKPDNEIVSESSQFAERGSGKALDSDLSQDTLPLETKISNRNEVAFREQNEASAHTKTSESTEILSGDHRQEFKIDEPVAPQAKEVVNKLDKNESEKRKISNETSKMRANDQPESVGQDNEYEQVYVEDPSQPEQYEQQDPNEQYEQYNQNLPYDGTGDQGYEGYAENQEYIQEGQQYVEYSENPAWMGIGDDQNIIRSPDQQYQNDPNAQYEEIAHGDPNEQNPNQEYDYNYDQQYDPNQTYEGEPNQIYEGDPNQAYEYSENNSYDPNQMYEGTYKQEYKEEQQNPDENLVNIESSKEKSEETEGICLKEQADTQLEREIDESKNQPLKADAVNEKSQSKKKDVIKSLLDSDTDTTIEKNVSNTESDFDFN